MSTVQSKPLNDGRRAGSAARTAYNKSGVIAVACVALILFLAGWGFNGYFTARAVVGLGQRMEWAWLTWGIGWSVHLIVSVCEQHAWKVPAYARAIPLLQEFYPHIRICMWILAIAVGSLDTLTTAVGIMELLPTQSFIGVALRVILAEATAVLPEPLIVGLAIFLYQMRRR